MRLCDANILIYAFDTSSPHHKRCKMWLDGHLNGMQKIGFPWPSLLAFVRIVTNPRIYEFPASIPEAWNQVEAWLGNETAFIPQPSRNHSGFMKKILQATQLKSNDLPDAHLAALAIEHGLILCSTDSDFSRYKDIKWENPLDQV